MRKSSYLNKIELFKFDDVFINSEGIHLKDQIIPFTGPFYPDKFSKPNSPYPRNCLLESASRSFKKRDDVLFKDAFDFPFNKNKHASPIYGLGCRGLDFDCYGLLWWTVQQLRAFENFDVGSKILLRTGKTYVNNVDFHFERLGFNQIRPLQPNKSFYVKKLFYAPSKEHPCHFSQDGIHWIRKKYVWENPNIDLNKTTKKIFLSRNKYWRRFTLNEEGFFPFLRDNGFKILDGTETQNEQIEHFRNAEIIIAPSGSMLKNTIFCDKNPLVIEIAGDNKILVESTEVHDINLPIQQIKKILKGII